MNKIPRAKDGNVQWQHTCSFTDDEKKKIEEVAEKENRTLNGAMRHMINVYKIQE